MSASINSVTLMGCLGRDPEIRQFENGGAVMTLSMATSSGYKNASTGQWVDTTQWHNVKINNKHLVDRLTRQELEKGDLLTLTGQLETRKWQDKEGNDRYST